MGLFNYLREITFIGFSALLVAVSSIVLSVIGYPVQATVFMLSCGVALIAMFVGGCLMTLNVAAQISQIAYGINEMFYSPLKTSEKEENQPGLM